MENLVFKKSRLILGIHSSFAKGSRFCFVGMSFFSCFFLRGGINAQERQTEADPHWDILGDFVYMRRQHSIVKSVINDIDKVRYCGACSDYSVLTTQKLINDQGFEPGFRVNAVYRYTPRFSFEGQFLWVSPWSEEQERKGDESLYFGFKDPFYEGDYIDANEAKARYLSEFWTAEANGWDHWTPRQVDYFSLSGLIGVRYFHFNEGLNITYFKPGAHSDYKIHTKSNAFGVQVGLDFQVNPTRTLTWEILSKFGFMMDLVEQKQFLRDEDNTVTIRHLKRSRWQNGCFSDTMAWIGLQCKEHVNLHGGYQLIYLSSVGTAEDQISKRLSSQAGKNVQPNGVVMIHGLFVGLVISF